MLTPTTLSSSPSHMKSPPKIAKSSLISPIPALSTAHCLFLVIFLGEEGTFLLLSCKAALSPSRLQRSELPLLLRLIEHLFASILLDRHLLLWHHNALRILNIFPRTHIDTQDFHFHRSGGLLASVETIFRIPEELFARFGLRSYNGACQDCLTSRPGLQERSRVVVEEFAFRAFAIDTVDVWWTLGKEEVGECERLARAVSIAC
jgi:hypothetical protein